MIIRKYGIDAWVLFGVSPWPNGRLRHWLRSFACVHATARVSTFELSRGAHWQATLVVDCGFGHGPQHPYMQCLGRLSPACEHRCSKWVYSCPPLGLVKAKWRCKGDKLNRHNAHNHATPLRPWELWYYLLREFLNSLFDQQILITKLLDFNELLDQVKAYYEIMNCSLTGANKSNIQVTY